MFCVIAWCFGLAHCQLGLCEKGSDSLCAPYGSEYCCAYVDIQSSSDQLQGFWCANKQYTGSSYNFNGYKGSIICSQAAFTIVSILV